MRPLPFVVLAVVVAIAFVMPVLIMATGSIKDDARVLPEAGSMSGLVPTDPTLENYVDVFERVAFARFFLNSLLITAAVTLLGLAVNSAAGYALARLEWRGRDALMALVVALLVVPFEAIAVPLFYGASVLGLRDTYVVQIVPFIANPFVIYLFYSYFLGLPRELEEAARLDGAGTWRTFARIIVPMSAPAYGASAVLVVLMQWGSYLWPLLVTSGPEVRPLPVAIAAFYTLPPLQWGDILAFGAMMAAPVIVAFLLLQRWIVRGVAFGGVVR
jgi:multiple sugar transport system permease protein